MNQLVHKFVELVEKNKEINTKDEMIEVVCNNFPMVKDGRALYHTDFFAVVFCYSKNNSFSNVVLSLSKLEKYDRIPCFVVLVKKDSDGLVSSVSYVDMIIPLVSEVQRLNNLIIKQQNEINELKSLIS